MAHYFDTSALTKLVVDESESAALVDWIGSKVTRAVSSDLARTELVRAVRRHEPEHMDRARLVLDSMTLLDVTTELFEAAGRLDPLSMRTLDSIHLAAALDLGDDLEAIVTYDERLADAARSFGIEVVAPSNV